MVDLRKSAPQIAPEPDPRFRRLMGEGAWSLLPAPIRRRFGKRLAAGMSVTYQGRVTTMEMSWLGWCLAQALRPVGAPLPLDRRSAGQAAVVVVTEDACADGQFWIRQYGRTQGFPQVVHSSKRFAGPTGLEEYIGYGIGMALTVEGTPGALLFRSAHYFIQIRGRRLRLPRWMTPGDLVIGHHDEGRGGFVFSLSLSHRLFGTLIKQEATFLDTVVDPS